MKRLLLSESIEELRAWLEEYGEPGYRADQIRNWVLQRRATNFEGMSDLPKSLRHLLAEDWTVLGSKIIGRTRDEDRSRKLLLRLPDGQTVECVMLTEKARRTVCLSTQVGCAMGCAFCASGADGLERNLSAGEMIEQLVHLGNLLPKNERPSHIVVMGMGEPLANLESLLCALEVATSPEGLGIGARRVTISTVGLPEKITRLAESGRAYHLAVSLHAPNDELRQQIVPLAKTVRLEHLLAASDHFRQQTGRQVTFEYVLLAEVNDRPTHARELADLLRGKDAMINLIPFNPVRGVPYRTPSPASSNRFASLLREAGLIVKIRKRKGANIEAACGQLRRSADFLVSLG